MKNLNYDGDSDSSGKRLEKTDGKDKKSNEKKRGKIFYKGESSNLKPTGKRKVTFTTPKNKIFFFDPMSAPLKPIRITGPEDTPQMAQGANKRCPTKEKGKQIYKIKGKEKIPESKVLCEVKNRVVQIITLDYKKRNARNKPHSGARASISFFRRCYLKS